MSDMTARRTVSGWTVGLVVFAAAIMIMVGAFQIIAGLAAIFDDQFFVLPRNYVFDPDPDGVGRGPPRKRPPLHPRRPRPGG